MPNWCNGVLKVRGAKEDIKSFLLGSFEPVGYFGEKVDQKEVVESDWELSIRSKHHFHVKGSRRNFVNGSVEFYFDDDKEIKILAIEGYESAWDIDVDTLVVLSREFGIDMKIYAFEKGMQFNRDIEIHKGEIIKNDVITFDDYDWECIDPTIGG